MKNQKGFSLIELLVVVIIIAIIAAIAIPSLLASRRAANHSATVANMRTVVSAQATYASLNAGDYATYAELNTADMIDDSWAAAGGVTKNGYTYALTPADPTSGFCLAATSMLFRIRVLSIVTMKAVRPSLAIRGQVPSHPAMPRKYSVPTSP